MPVAGVGDILRQLDVALPLAVQIDDPIAQGMIQVRGEIHDGLRDIRPLVESLDHVLHHVLGVTVSAVVDPRAHVAHEAIPFGGDKARDSLFLRFRAHIHYDDAGRFYCIARKERSMASSVADAVTWGQ